MSWKKKIKLAIAILLVALLIYGVRYAWLSFPLISGYNAKIVCSCVFVENRDAEKTKKEELGDFPKSLGSVKINLNDSSVTGTVWSFAKRKAIYRKGLGCTLVNDISEDGLRSQAFDLPKLNLINTDSIDWPNGDRIRDTLPGGLTKQKLNDAIDFAFEEKGNVNETGTRAVLVVYKGQLVGEKYAPGFDRHSRMIGWSIAKSYMGALIGILVNDGKLQISRPAPVAQWKDTADARHAISLENLLQQTSGLDFREDYTAYSEVTNMLFNKGDMAGYTAALSLKYTPGTVFNYSGGNSNILSRIIRNTVGEKQYPSFPYSALFHKIGMYNTLLEPDASGTFVGSSYTYAVARDFARFGLLYYNDGIWKGENILPEGWVKKTTTSPDANKLKNYGYQFWLNGFDKKDYTKRWYPDVPADMYFADGYGGQDIYIIPSKKMVVVRLGFKTMNENDLLKKIVAAVE